MDSWRLRQLHAHTAKPGHPYSTFGTGNYCSLCTGGRWVGGVAEVCVCGGGMEV